MSEHQQSTSLRDILPISVRAFVPQPKVRTFGSRKSSLGPSEWAVIFDTETTTDARQALRFGTYQVWKGNELVETGIFTNGRILSKTEQVVARKYASKHVLTIRTVEEFIEGVFYGIGYDLRATIVGFNLPFDLSRLAIRHGFARGKTMRGGFTLQLSRFRWRPQIQIKHLNARASLIQFTKPFRRNDSRGMRKRKVKAATRRGPFVDVKTLAAALLSRSFTLGSLADFLETKHRKQNVEQHGRQLTEAYIAYAMQDVQATWQCYRVLVERFESHGLTQTRVGQILSEASLGKAYLHEIGVRPWREVQPHFPDELIGTILSTYFGGRSEVHLRRTLKQVLYCDFLSMYPTVCTLMKLWSFVIARGVVWYDDTAAIERLLKEVMLEDFQQPEAWRALPALVQILPQSDLLPVRAKYDGTAQETIGLNRLSCEVPLWYTLADCIASKLLTGKAPKVLRAIRFEPREPQEGLQPVSVGGKTDYRIDPIEDDFFKKVIDLRNSTKAKLKTADVSQRARLDGDQQALKILANATSYGIFVEVIVGELESAEERMCFGPTEAFATPTTKTEEPGRFFHPLLATLITGAARLMLAITETLALKDGLDWAFCDTDSMALSKPEALGQDAFFERTKSVCNWFAPLSPYDFKGSLLKIETANYGSDLEKLMPLYCYAISSKRYVLFNLDIDGKPIIRKASAHGLGHLVAPYAEEDAPSSIPAPIFPLCDGVERWHHDLWYQIILSVLAGHPEKADLDYHPALAKPAASRYAATTPRLLRWFNKFNCDRGYRDQVKPMNFMLAFQALPGTLRTSSITQKCKRVQTKANVRPKPIAAFSADVIKAAESCFDRDTGELVASDQLKSYRQALAQYHLSTESKFLNGDYLDHGPTRRRHVEAIAINHIGKEANHWERQHYLGFDAEERVVYGFSPESLGRLRDTLSSLVSKGGQRTVSDSFGISRTTLAKLLGGVPVSLSPLEKVRRALSADP